MSQENIAPQTQQMLTATAIPRVLHRALAVEAARRGRPFEVLLCDAIRRELLRMGRADTGAGSDATHNHRYRLVKSLVQQGKLSPSVQELTDALSMSRATAQRYLVALQEEGVVERVGTGYMPRGCQRRVPWLDPKCSTDIRTLDEDDATECTPARTSAEPTTVRADPRYEDAKHLILSGAVAPRYRDLKLALHSGQQAVQRYLRAMKDEGVLVRHGRRWTVRTHQVLTEEAP